MPPVGTRGNGPTHLTPIPLPTAQRRALFLPREGLRSEVSFQERVLSLTRSGPMLGPGGTSESGKH